MSGPRAVRLIAELLRREMADGHGELEAEWPPAARRPPPDHGLLDQRFDHVEERRRARLAGQIDHARRRGQREIPPEHAGLRERAALPRGEQVPRRGEGAAVPGGEHAEPAPELPRQLGQREHLEARHRELDPERDPFEVRHDLGDGQGAVRVEGQRADLSPRPLQEERRRLRDLDVRGPRREPQRLQREELLARDPERPARRRQAAQLGRQRQEQPHRRRGVRRHVLAPVEDQERAPARSYRCRKRRRGERLHPVSRHAERRVHRRRDVDRAPPPPRGRPGTRLPPARAAGRAQSRAGSCPLRRCPSPSPGAPPRAPPRDPRAGWPAPRSARSRPRGRWGRPPKRTSRASSLGNVVAGPATARCSALGSGRPRDVACSCPTGPGLLRPRCRTGCTRPGCLATS